MLPKKFLCLLFFLACLFWGCAPSSGQSHFSVASVFSSHMVLQRDAPFSIYGTASPGTSVKAKLGSNIGSAVADGKRTWSIELASQPANTIPQSLSILAGDTSVIFEDILVGDVWLCAGQSNMDFPLNNAAGGGAFANRHAANPQIRLLQYKTVTETNNAAWDSATLQSVKHYEYFKGEWSPNSISSALSFSAVGYAFGAIIQPDAGVPIGLIQLAVGGSPQVAWLSSPALANYPQYGFMDSGWRSNENIMPWVRDRVDQNLINAPPGFNFHPFAPGYIFQAGILPLAGLRIKGMLWYQGESDAENPEPYASLFPAFIQEIRQFFKAPIPFYAVQLSSINRPEWPEFRDLQRRILDSIPGAGMAVTIDLGDSLNVHPVNKIPVGERLARFALRNDYGKDIPAAGPSIITAQRSGNSIRLDFTNGGLRSGNQLALTGFELEDEKGNSIATKATILQDKIMLAVPRNFHPRAVRYAWQPFTRANLVNEEGLPAGTFRIAIQE